MRALFVGLTLAVLIAPLGVAEEKNGLQVTIARKTLDRNDRRTGSYYYYSDRIDRTQGLKVTVKNVSFKGMPEGELTWTLLVKKYSGGTTEGYTGKETLKALKPAETVEMVIGSAEVRGWNDMSGQVKDKIEHQVVINQGGKETLRISSTPGFDAMAKHASFSTPTQRPAP